MKIQLDERNIQNIKEKNICKGKLCKYNGRTFEEEKDIFNWDKPEWELVWYKNKNEPYIRKENRTVMHELSKLNNYIKMLTNLDPYGKILNTAYYGRRFRAAQVIYSAPRSESIIKEG